MMEDYRNSALPPAQRARDLLGRMELREKVGQLNQRLYGFRSYRRTGDEFELTREFREEVERFGGLGVLYGLYRADPWADRDEKNGITLELSMKAYNMAQEYVISHSRLGIPMLLSSECPHGHQALGGGLLPVNLAAGATFDPGLLEKAYRACGRQLRSGHVDMALMSVLDVLRDPRWGRSEECYSEDPFLSARMASAAVRGMQSAQVSCVAKHFCAQGETTGGVNASAAGIGERELREIHFPPAEACCREGVEGIMAAYNEIDGVYCHSNPWLLRKVLRQEMGFGGVVMADGLAVDFLRNTGMDTLQAAAAALRAGVDISLWDEGFSRLEEAVEKGLVEARLLDEAVLRVLEMKFRRGLFEQPYMKGNMISGAAAGVEDLSLELARESAVLLENATVAGPDGQATPVLPLEKRFAKIGVFGFHATDRYSQLGDYTPPMPPESCVTVWEGMKELAPEGVEVRYALGSGFAETIPGERERALALAEESDVLVLVLGGSSSRFSGAEFDENGAAVRKMGAAEAEAAKEAETEAAKEAEAEAAKEAAPEKQNPGMDCGEGMDCALLEIPKAQQELLHLLSGTGRPVVTVLLAGRPYCMTELAARSAALLCVFYPGPMGGRAVAEILYGNRAPSGRLPVSAPRHPGQLPVYYNYKISCRPVYCDLEDGPLYAFGDGLTYTKFSYDEIQAKAGSGQGGGQAGLGCGCIATDEEEVLHISFRIRNIGQREGTAVPQLYIRRLCGDTTPRVRELKGFGRITLKPGQTGRLRIAIPVRELTAIGMDGNRRPYRGELLLWLCDGGTEYWSGRVRI